MEDHVHILLSAPPRCSPAQTMQIMKSITARELFARFPELTKELWAGELWADGLLNLKLEHVRSAKEGGLPGALE